MQGTCGAADREALRWFFLTHRREYGGQRQTYIAKPLPPPPMPIPESTPPWEAALIRAIRLRGLLRPRLAMVDSIQNYWTYSRPSWEVQRCGSNSLIFIRKESRPTRRALRNSTLLSRS